MAKHPERSPYGGRPNYSEEDLALLCEECKQYAEKPDSLTIEGFALSKRHVPSWANEIAGHYPAFKEAYEYCRYMVGRRREEGALKKVLSETLVAKTMGLYNKDFKEFVMTLAKLNSESERVINFYQGKKPEELEKQMDSNK